MHADDHRRMTVLLMMLSEAKNIIERQDNRAGQSDGVDHVNVKNEGGP
jgi:hypothetical protein